MVSCRKYQPPKGFSAIKDLVGRSCSADWDAVAHDTDLELWAVRVPNGVRSSTA